METDRRRSVLFPYKRNGNERYITYSAHLCTRLAPRHADVRRSTDDDARHRFGE